MRPQSGAPWEYATCLEVIQETRTAETRRTQRFLHILCALCGLNLGESSHPKIEHSRPLSLQRSYNELAMLRHLQRRLDLQRAMRSGAALLLSAGPALAGAIFPVHAQPSGQNLLKNPRFDWPAQTNGDVCAPGWQKDNAITPHEWTAYWTCKSGEEVFQDQVNRPPEFRMMTVDISPDRVRSYPTSASFFNYSFAQPLSWPLPDRAGCHPRHTPAL
jgi:hypothetical protein